MRRLLGIVACALASCVLPADTEAQELPPGVQDVCVAPDIVGRSAGGGTSSPYVVIDAATGDTVSRHNDIGNQVERAVSLLAGQDSTTIAFEQRVRCLERLSEWLRSQGLLIVQADSVVQPPPTDTTVTPPPPPPPPPPDTTAPPDTTGLAAPESMRTVSEAGEWWVAWDPVPGADAHVVSWLGQSSATTNGPNESGEVWMLLGDVGTLEGEEVCVSGLLAGARGPETCRTIGAASPQPPPPPPPPPGTTEWGMGGHRAGITWDPPATAPDLAEDWTAYTSLDDWMTRSQLPWRDHGQTRGFHPLGVNIHPAGDGTPHAGRGLKLRYRTGTGCTSDNMANIGPELALPERDTLWAEVTFSTSPNFTTRSPNCEAQGIRRADHKTFLVWVTTDPATCSNAVCTERPEYKIGSGGGIEARVPYGGTPRDSVVVNAHSIDPYCRDTLPNVPDLNGDGRVDIEDCRHHPPRTMRSDLVDPATVWDGEEHTFRFYVARVGPNRWELAGWIDGVLTHDYWTYVNEPGRGVLGTRYALFGSNRNTSADEDMWFYFRSFRIWVR